jgi:hypothetical protein
MSVDRAEGETNECPQAWTSYSQGTSMKAFLSLAISILGAVAFAAEIYVGATFISVKEAKIKWGQKALVNEVFRRSKPEDRAPMAVDAIEKNAFKGKRVAEIREALGDPDGYFFSKSILAYLIQSYSKHKKEAWQLVFIPDDNLEMVKEVRIHKKCCDPLPEN